jgi:DNA modification methylase
MIKLSEIKKNPRNPRFIKDDKFEKLKLSLKAFPQMMKLRPIVIDENNIILGGNMRFEALKANGLKEIPDEWVKRGDDLTEDQKLEFIAKDNISFGSWDDDMLANEWDHLPLTDWGLDLPVMEEPPEEEGSGDAEPQMDKAEELNKKWQVKLGDLFLIGEHRLLCGDSTNKETVERVLDGAKPNLMITDPPYGVEYDANWRNEAARNSKGMGNRAIGAGAVGKVMNDDNADWTAAWQLFTGNVVYCWHAGLHASTVDASLKASGFELRSQIIWAKSNFAISRGHYHWKHEPCWYAVRKGENAAWIGGHSNTTLWEIDKPQKSETGHSTQKPLECMARPIRNHEGDVYEPFAGSGTTLVASQNLNRKCYAIELSPAYVAVILERMSEAFPGIEIKKIE